MSWTRQQYIDAVKVKLEEISPFYEPENFIADGDDAASTTKPIISYIDQSLDEAAHNCLNSLPLTLLHADIERTTGTLYIDVNGVGFVRPLSTARRFVRLRQNLLKRDITAFISSEDPLYLLQQNEHTRGGIAKPVAVFSSDNNGVYSGQMEIYSFPEAERNTNSEQYVLLSINVHKHPDDKSTVDPAFTDTDCVKSPIEEYIVLECAAMVASILGDAATAQTCQAQFQAKLQSLLQ